MCAAPGDFQPERPSDEALVRSHGLNLRVVINPGTSDAIPLLLMNGIGARLELLDPLVNSLERSRTIIRFDAPKIGGSTGTLRPYRLRRLSHAIAGILDELGFAEVDVLGISWGGGVAQQFAYTEKNRCRRLVLVSTATGSIMVPAHPRILAKMLSPRRYTNPALLLDGLAQDLYGGTMRVDNGAALAALKQQQVDTVTLGYFLQLGAAAMWTSIFFLPFVDKRTLILAGDDDPIVPKINGSILNRLMPKSQLHVYEGGHIAVVTESDEFAPVIDAFLDAD